MSLSGDLAPLQTVLNEILTRIEKIENKIGGDDSNSASLGTASDSSDSPAVTAYDKHVSTALEPFLTTIKSLPGIGESSVPNDLSIAWSCIRSVVVAGSQCKKPSNIADLAPMLKPAQDSIANIRKIRLAREYDNHIKAMMEMLACLGWVMIDATSEPPSPSLFVKGTVGSSDFWANKIRKQYKGKKDEVAKNNVKFCDDMKALILDLAAYTKEHHMSGLKWNFNGIELKDFEGDSGATKSIPALAPAATTKNTSVSGGIADIKAELAKKTSSAGNSAATGLKKVTKEQQTWRKEFKSEDAGRKKITINLKSKFSSKSSSAKPAPNPVFEYRDRGSKWVIEYQTKASTENSAGIVTVEVKDPKQHVYIYKCEDVTFDIKGKANSIVIDSCKKCNVVFENVISSCEVVNCNKIQTQVKGTCPSFSVDKTDGFLTYLSKESAAMTNFVTCKSSEMNVNYPGDDDEIKELPIPEQFQHKLVNGAIQSEVSDLYH